jgi:hypothetical protein
MSLFKIVDFKGDLLIVDKREGKIKKKKKTEPLNKYDQDCDQDKSCEGFASSFI